MTKQNCLDTFLFVMQRWKKNHCFWWVVLGDKWTWEIQALCVYLADSPCKCNIGLLFLQESSINAFSSKLKSINHFKMHFSTFTSVKWRKKNWCFSWSSSKNLSRPLMNQGVGYLIGPWPFLCIMLAKLTLNEIKKGLCRHQFCSWNWYSKFGFNKIPGPF